MWRYYLHTYCAGAGEEAELMVFRESDSTDEVGPDGGKKSKSGAVRRRRRGSSTQFNSLTSFHSVDGRSRQVDPSLRCVSVSSATQGFVTLRKCPARCCL